MSDTLTYQVFLELMRPFEEFAERERRFFERDGDLPALILVREGNQIAVVAEAVRSYAHDYNKEWEPMIRAFGEVEAGKVFLAWPRTDGGV